MTSRAVKPGHYKATIAGKLRYACMTHFEALRLAAFQPVTDIADAKANYPQNVAPSERDSPSAWCTYCYEEQTKETQK